MLRERPTPQADHLLTRPHPEIARQAVGHVASGKAVALHRLRRVHVSYLNQWVAPGGDQDIWFSNWAFRELAARVAKYSKADSDILGQLTLAEAFGGLSLDDLPPATRKLIASIMIDTARDMAGELERPSDDKRDAPFAERFRELVTFPERLSGLGRLRRRMVPTPGVSQVAGTCLPRLASGRLAQRR